MPAVSLNIDHLMIGKRLVEGVPTGDFCIFGSSLDEVPPWAIDEGRALAGSPSMYPIESTSEVKPNGWTVGRWHDELRLLVYAEAWGEAGRGVVVQSHVLIVPDELSKQIRHNCWRLAEWLNTRKGAPWFRFPAFESASEPPVDLDPLMIEAGAVSDPLPTHSFIAENHSAISSALRDITTNGSAVIGGCWSGTADRLATLNVVVRSLIKPKGRPGLGKRIAATTHPRNRLRELVDVGFEDPLEIRSDVNQ